jgi:hypothetical protein
MPAKKDVDNMVFEYVNVWYTDAEGKPKADRRIEAVNIKKFQQEIAENFNCFASIQQFCMKTKPEKGKGELHTAPLYFDLDFEEDPNVAKVEAAIIIDFFTRELDLQPYDLQVFFSGSKGFHLLVHQKALGIEPRYDLQKVFKYIAGYLRHRLGTTNSDGAQTPLQSIDPVVYTSPRMLRLNNSVHQKTKLYKIELNITDLMNLSLTEIKELAKTPRQEFNLNYTGVDRQEMKLRPKAAQFYADKLREYEEAMATANNRYDKEIYTFTKDNPPVCVQDIVNNGWKKQGDRNNATVQLSCYFKDAGFTKEETMETLEAWVVKFTSAKSDYDKQQRAANTRNVVESIFALDNEYKFGCAFIRSLHGPRESHLDKNYDRVPCSGTLCNCLKKKGQADEPPIPLHLASTGNATLTGRRIATKVMVAGKKHTPYIIPKKIEYTCWGSKNCKKFGCPLLQIPTHTSYKDLSVIDRELIQMCGIGDDNIKGIIKQLAGIPSCAKYDTAITETINVDELLVIPMADDNTNDVDLTDTNKGKYVLRKVYAVGNLEIKENKYYEIIGYVYPHPKNQEGTIIVESADPLQDIVERFELTPEVKRGLEIFQPQTYETGADIHKKLDRICKDLTYNVTRIVERDETLLAALLTYHSVLRFHVPWDSLPIRGWLECVIIGDSATAKSTLLRQITDFIGLGVRVDAGSTTRTGLTYKMEQNGSGGSWYIVWGAWPLADKELIWIDEMAKIKREEYAEMTAARSSGKLEVKRAVTSETTCRVRALLSGNPVREDGNNRLSEYRSGVESLKDIMNNEDIRRFDFGIFMKSSDVNPELVNRQLPIYPKSINAEVLRNNILFAWSRKPDQVEFDGSAMDEMLKAATDISKIYGNAADVPLVSPADQRNKICRLTVALAALTHSVDSTGEKIIVYKGHVEYITAYLTRIYNAPGCGLNQYARLAIREEDLTEKQFQDLSSHLRTVKALEKDNGFYEFIGLFSSQGYLRMNDIEAMLGMEKNDAKGLINLLMKLKMIKSTPAGMARTARFNSFIQKCFTKGMFDQMESDI